MTGWRAPLAAPRGHLDCQWLRRDLEPFSISRSEREWSASCLPSRVTMADFAPPGRSGSQYPGWDSNPHRPILRPAGLPVPVPGPLRRGGSRGTRTHTRYRRYLFSRQAPHPAGWLPFDRRGVTSTAAVPGAGIEPAASTFRAWRRYQQLLPRSQFDRSIREGGFEPPPPDSKSGSLPVSRFPRAVPAGVEPACSDCGRAPSPWPPGHGHMRICGELNQRWSIPSAK